MTWWRRKQDTKKELAEAMQADKQSEASLAEAREGYREALRMAKTAKRINAQNHFSESLNHAYGG